MKYITFSVVLFYIHTLFAQQITPELVQELKKVSNPICSRDGKYTIYELRQNNIKENTGQTDIYLLNNNSGETTLFAGGAGNQFSPNWKPNTTNIIGYFDENKFIEKNIETGDTKVFEHKLGDIDNFQYAPDGKHISFTKEVKVDVTAQDIYPDLPKANAKIYDGLMYRHWTTWEDGLRNHVFIAEYPSFSNEIDIMQAQPFDSPLKPHGGIEQIAWSIDGQNLAYTCKKKYGTAAAYSTNSDIYVYNINTYKTENISENNLGYDTHPIFSPDGKHVAWLSMKEEGNESDKNRIIVMNIATREKEDITLNIDLSIDDIKWNIYSNAIFFQCAIEATRQLFIIDIKTKKLEQLTNGMHDYTSFDIAGTSLISIRNSMMQPHEIFSVNLTSKAQKQRTFHNKDVWSKLELGSVEKRWIKTTDGKQMLTWVAFPPNFDKTKKYPTLLYCQGGPQSVVSQFFSYRWNVATMVANGYIVILPNRRGLPSFGQAWNDAITGDYGGQAMLDLLSAFDEVSKEPYVDKAHCGAVGASFGGFTVYWLMGNHQKRFKTFIAHCGIFNMESMYGETEEMFFVQHDNKGAPWDTPKPVNYSFSPHLFVKNWDTPLLVIHNEKDFRVPLSQGMGAFTAAQKMNIKSRFLYFSDEGHWVTKPQNGVLWSREFFRWLKETI